MKKRIVQIHHQFENGHTEFIAQREISSNKEINKWIGKLWETDPSPMCSQFMVCTEGSPYFLMMAA